MILRSPIRNTTRSPLRGPLQDEFGGGVSLSAALALLDGSDGIAFSATDDSAARTNSATPANTTSTAKPWNLFSDVGGPKYTFGSDASLDHQVVVYDGTNAHFTPTSSQKLPDGQGGDTGEGFTCTGLVYGGGSLWVGNDGGNVAGDTSRLPSVVQVSLDGATKLSEIDIGTIYTSTSSVQGVAYDTTDDTLWVAQVSDGQLRHVSTSGVDEGDGFAISGVNGVAYDSLRDKLWCLAGTTLTLRQKDGTIDATITVGALSDQLCYDAERDAIIVTSGTNGSAGVATYYDAADAASSTATTLGTATFPSATAIEGMAIIPETNQRVIAHDGYYHAPDGAVIQENQLQFYSYVEGASTYRWAKEYKPSDLSLEGYLFEREVVHLADKRSAIDEIPGASLRFVTVNTPDQGAVSPTGENSYRVAMTSDNTQHRIVDTYSAAASGYVHSVIVKKNDWDYLGLYDRSFVPVGSAAFNLDTGAVIGASAGESGYSRDLSSGWYWMEERHTRASSGTGGINITFNDSTYSGLDWEAVDGSGLESFDLAYYAIENGNYATSYWPGNTAGTRPADAPATTTTLINWGAFNTFYAEFFTTRGLPLTGVDQVLFCADDGTANNRIRVYRDDAGDGYVEVTTGGVQQALLSLGALADYTSYKLAVRLVANDFAAYLDGSQADTDTSGTMPTVSNIRLAHDQSGANQFDAPIKEWAIRCGVANDNAALAALTA